MRIERVIDTERGTVRFAFELPLGLDPDRAGDIAWEHVTRLMEDCLPPLTTTETG